MTALLGQSGGREAMVKSFASTGDLGENSVSFTEIGPDLYAFAAGGDRETWDRLNG